MVENLGKIETKFENTLACFSGDQVGSNLEKNTGRKSRDTLPLMLLRHQSHFVKTSNKFYNNLPLFANSSLYGIFCTKQIILLSPLGEYFSQLSGPGTLGMEDDRLAFLAKVLKTTFISSFVEY